MSLTFTNPLFLFLIPPAIWCLWQCRERSSFRWFVNVAWFKAPVKRVNEMLLIKMLVVTLFLIAFASPFSYDPNDPKNRQGIDLVLSIDGSGSMAQFGFDAQNRLVSKFVLVQDLMRDFIQKRLHDNVGVVLFGDFAFTASPVTYEKEAIVQMVDYLQVGMAGENTAIGEGILMAVRALSFSKAKSKVIVLLTDGMQNSGSISPKEALKTALETGVKIYTIGIGKKGEYEAPLLKQIAKQSGGKFFEASHIEALRSVYNAINQLERSAIDSDQIYAKVLWYPYFLLGAFLLLIFSVIRQKGAV